MLNLITIRQSKSDICDVNCKAKAKFLKNPLRKKTEEERKKEKLGVRIRWINQRIKNQNLQKCHLWNYPGKILTLWSGKSRYPEIPYYFLCIIIRNQFPVWYSQSVHMPVAASKVVGWTIVGVNPILNGRAHHTFLLWMILSDESI